MDFDLLYNKGEGDRVAMRLKCRTEATPLNVASVRREWPGCWLRAYFPCEAALATVFESGSVDQ